MAMLKMEGYEPERTQQAIEMLLIDRKNELKELGDAIFWNVPSSMQIKNWEEFILTFCLDVNEAFSSWTGDTEIAPNSDLKALTILRQLSRDKTSMIQMTRLLNIAYDLAEEFKVIYKRIQ